MSAQPNSPTRPDAICPVRRGLLAAAGGISVTAVLAACGDDYSGYSVPPVNNAGATGAAGDGGGSGGSGGSGAPADSGDAGGTGDAVATTADIPVGGGKVVDGLLIMQPEKGRFRAFDAACPHQGVQVAPPEDGTISCPGHGATFDEQGQVTGGPAQKGLTRRKLRVRSGEIFRA